MDINLIKGDSVGDETDYRDALPVNMTAVLKPMMGADGYMLQYPGLTEFAYTGGECRGGIYNERLGIHFRVSGTTLESIADDGTVANLGTTLGNDTVSLPYSFNTQGIVSSGLFYLYDPTLGFREVTDPDLGRPIDCVWVDGYYFFTDGDFVYHTDISDESSIDPLKFATAEFMPDPSNGVGKTQDNKVIVFGRYTTEYFVNDASENFAFQRINTRALKIGIVGTHAKAELNDKWYILGGRKEGAIGVYELGVGSAPKVSTREIDKLIGMYTETQLSSVVVEAYTEDGYSYVIVHLPDYTLIFNETLATKLGTDQAWSIISSYSTIKDGTEWRGKHGVFEPRLGKWVFGDKEEGKLAILDNTVSTHYGNIAEWVLFTPFIYLENQSVDKLEIETVPGHTTTDDATVFVSMSYDGVMHGHEWTKDYGAMGEYSKRFILRRLGYVRNWFAFKLRGASRSRMAFARATIDHG